MFGFNQTKVGTERLAYRLVWAYARMVAGDQRPIDLKLARAEFRGMAKAANAIGYGMTETHVEMVVGEVMVTRPQPRHNATSGAAREAWEQESTEALTKALDAIR